METFSQEAMATRWTIRTDDFPMPDAAHAVHEAFIQLTKLENLLSCFIASSDVSRINALHKGERVWVQAETWECLTIANRISTKTKRAFDPAAGTITEFWKSQNNASNCGGFCEEMPEWRAAFENFRFGTLAMHEDSHEIECVNEGSKIDLSGIAKGFALDVMAESLRSWGVERALLSAGGSTILALKAPLDKDGWKIGFSDETQPITLCGDALSSSGTQFHSTHLVDPRTGLRAVNSKTVRILAKTGAEADALSTAFFCMNQAEKTEFLNTVPAGTVRQI